jgi:Tfp pilus assembly protein PilO
VQIDLTLKSLALPWAVLVVLTVGCLLAIGEGNLPWALAGEVRDLEAKLEELEDRPVTSEPQLELPKVRKSDERTAEALLILQQAGSEAGLVLGEVRPEPQHQERRLLKTPITVSFRGTVESAVDFLYLLEEDYPSIFIERMRMGASKEGLDVELKVTDRALLEAGENG